MPIPTKTQLGLLDLQRLPPKAIPLGALPTPLPSEVATHVSLLFAVDGLLVERRERRLRDGRRKAINQFEMPLAALPWIVESIESRFERKPSEGGLARASFHVDGTVSGEDLEIRYGASVGGDGIGGYTVTNFARQCYILPEATQELSFSIDDWRKTVRDLLRSTARRYEAGELG